MIEKGILPIQTTEQEQPKNNIKKAFLYAGAGFGLLMGYFVQIYFGMKQPFSYLSMTFLFAGIGLIIYYLMASKGKFQNL